MIIRQPFLRNFLRVLKHVLLFYFANALGAFLFLSILEDFSEGPSLFLIAVFLGAFFAMLYTFIPFCIFIFVLKRMAKPALWVYAFCGFLTPTPVLLIPGAFSNDPVFFFLPLAGAFCGFLYGVLDKKIRFERPAHTS